jgi:hypothetical protein
MDKKMEILFDPKKRGREDDLNTVYEKIFEIREKRPDDFVISALFSALMDAKISNSRIFILKSLSHERNDNVIFDFKRCKLANRSIRQKKHRKI